MSSSFFHAGAIVVVSLFGIAGLILLFLLWPVGLSLLLTGFLLFFVMEFFATVVGNQEEMIASIKMINETISPSTKDLASKGPAELTVGLTPPRNDAKRSHALERIKQTGFKSTEKYKYGDYLIAIDSNRMEWVVITPDGENSIAYPFDKFQGCKVNIDESNGRCFGVEVLVFVVGETVNPIHIVLMDRGSGSVSFYSDLVDEAEKICRFINSINSKTTPSENEQ